MNFQAGMQVNRFLIRERIGRGGMGEVFRAWDPVLLRDVALKRAGDMTGEAAGRKVRREGRLASAVRHPAIVRIYDVVEHEGLQLIVQEFVEGETLRSRLSRADVRRTPDPSEGAVRGSVQADNGPDGSPIDLPSFFPILKTCLEALADIASEHMVHGDLKPENIMLDRSGHARILDFGLARIIGPADAPSNRERVGSAESLSSTIDLDAPIQGTPGYIAPEILSGEEPNVQSDLFSLGVVAYELLTGQNPFVRKTASATLAAALHDRPEPPSRYTPDVPSELDELVMAMLEKDRNARPSNPGNLVVDLLRIEREYQDRLSSGRIVPRMAMTSLSRLANAPPPPGRHVLLIVDAFRSLAGEPEMSSVAERMTEGVREGVARLRGVSLLEGSAPSAIHVTGRVRGPTGGRGAGGVPPTAEGQRSREIRLECDFMDRRGDGGIAHHRAWDFTTDQIIETRDAVCSWIATTLGLPDRSAALHGATPDPTAFDYYLRGRTYLRQQGQVADAIQLFEKALSMDPEYPQALAGLGEAYLVRYRLDRDPDCARQAEHLVQRAHAIAPDSPDVRLALARTYLENGKSALAIPIYRGILEADSWNFQAALGLSRALESEGRIGDAEEMLVHAVRIHPDHWMAHNASGAFYLRHGRYADALNSFLRVVDLAPDSARGYSNLGIAYQSLGRDEEAREAYRRSIQIAPTYPALSNLATLAYSRGDCREAIENYEKALAIDSHDHRVWGCLAAALTQAGGAAESAAGSLREAIDRAERLREVNPNDPLLLACLGQYYAQFKESTVARRLLARALELEPDRVDVLLVAAPAYEDLGDAEAARETLIRAIDLGGSVETLKREPGYVRLLSDPEIMRRLTERG